MLRSIEVKSHWQTIVENFNTSTLDFYKTVEEAVAKRQLPDVTFARTDMKEGGLLSAKREYLLVKRGNLTFAICSAPYGTGQFFSWWLLETLPRFALLYALAFLAVLPIIFISMIGAMGIIKGFVWFIILGGAALWVVGYSDVFDTAELDATLLAIPYFGSVYQKLFRPATFYAADTTAMFQESVRQAVKEAMNDVCTAKGVRALGAEVSAPAGSGR
jgi:hypothetical protein